MRNEGCKTDCKTFPGTRRKPLCRRHFSTSVFVPTKQTKQPAKVIDAAMIQAVQIAEKVAPCRSLINSRHRRILVPIERIAAGFGQPPVSAMLISKASPWQAAGLRHALSLGS